VTSDPLNGQEALYIKGSRKCRGNQFHFLLPPDGLHQVFFFFVSGFKHNQASIGIKLVWSEIEHHGGLGMDLRVLDLQYRLEQTQRHLKGNRYLSQMYQDDIKEIEKILMEIRAMINSQNKKLFLM